jgi:hypothetical protein
MDKLRHQQGAQPIPIQQLRPDVPAHVATVVRTLLAKKPRDRFQDPAEVVSLLRPYLRTAGDTVTDSAGPTIPGLPVPAPQPVLPRTEELPVGQLQLVTNNAAELAIAPRTWREWGNYWLNRLHWFIAAVIAGAAMGVIISRG